MFENQQWRPPVKIKQPRLNFKQINQNHCGLQHQTYLSPLISYLQTAFGLNKKRAEQFILRLFKVCGINNQNQISEIILPLLMIMISTGVVALSFSCNTDNNDEQNNSSDPHSIKKISSPVQKDVNVSNKPLHTNKFSCDSGVNQNNEKFIRAQLKKIFPAENPHYLCKPKSECHTYATKEQYFQKITESIKDLPDKIIQKLLNPTPTENMETVRLNLQGYLAYATEEGTTVLKKLPPAVLNQLSGGDIVSIAYSGTENGFSIINKLPLSLIEKLNGQDIYLLLAQKNQLILQTLLAFSSQEIKSLQKGDITKLLNKKYQEARNKYADALNSSAKKQLFCDEKNSSEYGARFLRFANQEGVKVINDFFQSYPQLSSKLNSKNIADISTHGRQEKLRLFFSIPLKISVDFTGDEIAYLLFSATEEGVNIFNNLPPEIGKKLDSSQKTYICANATEKGKKIFNQITPSISEKLDGEIIVEIFKGEKKSRKG